MQQLKGLSSIEESKSILDQFFQAMDRDCQSIKQSKGFNTLAKMHDTSYSSDKKSNILRESPTKNMPAKHAGDLAKMYKNGINFNSPSKGLDKMPMKMNTTSVEKENSPFKRVKQLKKQESLHVQ